MINKQRLLDLFFDYVKIDSETGFEKDMADRISNDLEKLGLRVYKDEIGSLIDSTGYNIYAYLDGDSNLEPILLSAHMDTVVPGKGIEPYVENGYIKSKGDTILGGDDKSGIAAIIEAIRAVQENGLKTRPIEILFTVKEESGLLGSKNTKFERLQSKWGLVLDSGGDVGNIITMAPGQLKISAVITGKAAHAGVAPETGVSAIVVAAEAVSQMKLLRIDEQTTANIGTFKAESPTNIVCDKVEIIAEARSRNYDKLIEQGEHMKQCFESACKKYGATFEINIETAYVSYAIADSEPLVQLVCNKMKDLKITPTIRATGGGSDANIYNLGGICSLVLGTGMDKVHTSDEQLTIENLEKMAQLLCEIIQA